MTTKHEGFLITKGASPASSPSSGGSMESTPMKPSTLEESEAVKARASLENSGSVFEKADYLACLDCAKAKAECEKKVPCRRCVGRKIECRTRLTQKGPDQRQHSSVRHEKTSISSAAVPSNDGIKTSGQIEIHGVGAYSGIDTDSFGSYPVEIDSEDCLSPLSPTVSTIPTKHASFLTSESIDATDMKIFVPQPVIFDLARESTISNDSGYESLNCLAIANDRKPEEPEEPSERRRKPRADNLKGYLRTDSDGLAFASITCGETFKQRENLTKHEFRGSGSELEGQYDPAELHGQRFPLDWEIPDDGYDGGPSGNNSFIASSKSRPATLPSRRPCSEERDLVIKGVSTNTPEVDGSNLYYCPITTCKRHTRGFSRKYNLNEHRKRCLFGEVTDTMSKYWAESSFKTISTSSGPMFDTEYTPERSISQQNTRPTSDIKSPETSRSSKTSSKPGNSSSMIYNEDPTLPLSFHELQNHISNTHRTNSSLDTYATLKGFSVDGRLKEIEMNTSLEMDCSSKILEKTISDLSDDFVQPPAITKLKEGNQIVLEPLNSYTELCHDALTKVPGQADNNLCFESPHRDEISCSDILSECSETETASSESFSESSIVSPLLGAFKRKLIDILMREFKALLDQNREVRSRATSTESSNNSSPKPASGEKRGQQGLSGKGKRKARDEDGGGSSREDDDDDRPKKLRIKDPSQELSPSRYACPYYRRNPQKYKNIKYRSCAGPGWTSVHRVKEHVLRQHCLPIHCHRCGAIFEIDTALAVHQRLPQGCGVSIFEHQGCSKEQEKLLRKRKRGLGSEANKWKEMYKCLFPIDNEEMMPTPYYDYEQVPAWESRRDDEFTQYEEYLGQELPRVVRQRLEQVVSESARPLESELRAQLVDIVRDAQSDLFRSYRQDNVLRVSPVISVQAENGMNQVQTDAFDFEQLHPPCDFSAFFAPPLVANNFSNPVGVGISALEGTSGIYQPMSDSGYGSNGISFDVNTSGFGGYDAATGGDFSNIFNSEKAHPPVSGDFL